MNGGTAKVRTVPLFQRRDQLGEIQLIVNPDQQVIGVNEVPQAFAGELEEGGVPTAAVQRLEHRYSSQMMDCSPILTQEPHGPTLMPTFSTSPYLRRLHLVSPGIPALFGTELAWPGSLSPSWFPSKVNESVHSTLHFLFDCSGLVADRQDQAIQPRYWSSLGALDREVASPSFTHRGSNLLPGQDAVLPCGRRPGPGSAAAGLAAAGVIHRRSVDAAKSLRSRATARHLPTFLLGILHRQDHKDPPGVHAACSWWLSKCRIRASYPPAPATRPQAYGSRRGAR